MNSGLQDAFNLAWKLALVCQGKCSCNILDSYEAERRPVALTITASGEAIERAQMLTGPAERSARDETLRAVFANPASRHHEVIAEAELDIDYAGSPIVIGDHHEALGPGQRLADTIEICLAGGLTCGLHELTNRAGHTALLIGGPSADESELARLEACINVGADSRFLEATFALTAQSGHPHRRARLAPAAAADLGIAEVTLLVIRPDGHIGLRADRDHIQALAAYHALLASGRS